MTSAAAVIRVEQRPDAAAVGALLRRCFSGEPVDALVQALRAGPGYLPELALVAVDERIPGGIAGYVAITRTAAAESPDRLDENGFHRAEPLLCLSPLAVHPAAAGRGLARALVEEVLARAARHRPEPYVVLEGDPALYRRFGFVAAGQVGLRSPSQRIPQSAFQAAVLPATGDRPRGRVVYDEVFWTGITPGLPFAGIAWLDELEQCCRGLERLLRERVEASGPATVLATEVPACPGWTVADVLDHLATIHRVVIAWLREGRRPRAAPPAPGEGPIDRFGRGWRAVHDELSARSGDQSAATWCPWEATVAFWQRRMAHEHAVHVADLGEALEGSWQAPPDLAVDGVDEALRLWLGTRLGAEVRGRGDGVRIVAHEGPARSWTVVLHQRFAEIHELAEIAGHPVPVEAEVSGPPVELYRWVWGRQARVSVTGDPESAQVLREALVRACG